MKWRVLAWDDRPQKYVNDLCREMEEDGSFEVTLEVKIADCFRRFNDNQDEWDCLLLDLMDDTTIPEKPDKSAGVKLAKNLRDMRPDIPIIFLTDDVTPIFESGIKLEQPMLIRPKSYSVHFMLMDVVDFMKRWQSQFDKVFIIYGKNRRAESILQKVKAALKGHNLRYEVLKPEGAMESIPLALVKSMKECGAFVAICTPDDQILGQENYYQPRQNVLLEIGVAMGASQEFNKLVILQRCGDNPEEHAMLPSDLGGALTISFYDDENHQDAIERMLEALKQRGVRPRNYSEDEKHLEMATHTSS